MKIQKIEISKIKKNPGNPRTIKDEKFKKLVQSLKDFPEMMKLRPIVVNKEMTILGGNMRYEAAKSAGWKMIDIIIANRLTKEQEKEFTIKDNIPSGTWDFDILSSDFELPELLEWGFMENELDLNLWSDKTEEQLDDVPEVQKVAVSKLGDLFLLDGRHRILCGDSTKKEDVEKLMDGRKAELLFTSPPYSDMRTYGGDKDLSIKSLTGFILLFSDYVKYQIINLGIQRKDNEINQYWDEYIKKARDSGYKFLSWNVWNRSGSGGSVGNINALFPIEHEWIFIFGKDFNKKEVKKTVRNKHAGQHRSGGDRQADGTLINKRRIINDLRRLGTVQNIDFERDIENKRLHPAVFPVKLPIEFIMAITINSGIVSEPFLGSGSTLIACEQTNRICYGMEICPEYVDVSIRRYHNLYPDKEIKCITRKDFNFKKLYAS